MWHVGGGQLVHLDVKSANVLLSADGETAKLADFGLAQVKRAQFLEASACGKGTVGYMAPEVGEQIIWLCTFSRKRL